MKKALEQFLLKRWYSDKPIQLLKPLSWLYSKVATSKRLAYQNGTKDVYKAPLPVIVVGNITVGGTGKTPVVVFLVEELRKRGLKPAVISRGYGVDVTTNRLVVESSSYLDVGDEPKLIKARTNVPVAVGRNRQTSIELILKEYPETNVIVSDDGLQHYALARDVELAVIDSERGLGNGELIPSGPLRETKDRLEVVDAVLINGDIATQVDGIRFNLLGQTIINLKTEERKSLSDFNGELIHAYAGIGNPERFFTTLRIAGLSVHTHFTGDHAVMPESFFSEHKEHVILTTEKDAIKLPNDIHDNLWYLPVDVVMQENDKLELLSRITNKLNS